jgi:hypothetical protein
MKLYQHLVDVMLLQLRFVVDIINLLLLGGFYEVLNLLIVSIDLIS